MMLNTSISLAQAIVTKLVRRKSDQRQQLTSEADYDEIVALMVAHNVWTVLPDNPLTLH